MKTNNKIIVISITEKEYDENIKISNYLPKLIDIDCELIECIENSLITEYYWDKGIDISSEVDNYTYTAYPIGISLEKYPNDFIWDNLKHFKEQKEKYKIIPIKKFKESMLE